MTRPPDFDLATVEGIVRTVEAMRRASRHAREAMYMARFQYSKRDWDNGLRFATEAAHHARRLQGVAELVSVSGDLAAWQEWRERGRA